MTPRPVNADDARALVADYDAGMYMPDGPERYDLAHTVDAQAALLDAVWRLVANGHPPPVSDRETWLALVSDHVADYDAGMLAAQAAEIERLRADLARTNAERDALRDEADLLRESYDAATAQLGDAVTEQLAVTGERDAARADLTRVTSERDRLQRACDEGLPRERIDCPACGLAHVEGPRHDDPSVDGRTRPHHTHRCYGCGHVWDAGRWSFGVDKPHGPLSRVLSENARLCAAVREMFDAEAANAALFDAELASGEALPMSDESLCLLWKRMKPSVQRIDTARSALDALTKGNGGDR